MIAAFVLIASGLLHCAAAITPPQKASMKAYQEKMKSLNTLYRLYEKYITTGNLDSLKPEENFVAQFVSLFQDFDNWIFYMMTNMKKDKSLPRIALSLYHNDTKALERFLLDAKRNFNLATMLHEKYMIFTKDNRKIEVHFRGVYGKSSLDEVYQRTMNEANSNSGWKKQFKTKTARLIKEKDLSPIIERDLVQALAAEFPKRKWLAITYPNPDIVSTGCLGREYTENYISQRLPSGRYLLLLQIPKERDFNAAVNWAVIDRFQSSRGNYCPASAAEMFTSLRLSCESVKPGSFVGVFKTLLDAPTVYVEASHPSSFKQIWKKPGGPKCQQFYSLVMFG